MPIEHTSKETIDVKLKYFDESESKPLNRKLTNHIKTHTE